ncbi:hypothetical protein CFC21_001182 [Triticum aestivum]|uniref:RING-type E3 ubiquitin transferase n=1 Tax=Triticum aestivum TaxID=4565 RepID=A0A3B5XW76_WHEAT|nr:probable E3 ubiquitin-protein ligase RHG1A [Triticum dicoccoides]XP_037488044.1 probable E3 ubiquitin-protein ligase RHG1A [Triticum dicoccoides]XP_037488052.1 probable E3 ubiquitin-protein ligase RHG1A [Triticum dicoccoides]XP_037488059.1 probable E3 ubiquitin-protein ligase RHG1A [Triticum dicoccoides]XP_037488067.1 probable E3 ubiquitin-protein ligase RHG1A [Triticum dicoccoides]XP_037488071.1 probable E3 ubiquitin-protein ligase RHG1A [Triticum dicoccoides]XP_037488078.1 probable E3 ub
MAGHHYHNSQISRMDRTNQPRNEPPPFGQKLFMHPRGDAPNGAGPSGYGVTTVRSNELPSSSYAGQSYGQQMGAPGTLHASHAGYPPAGSSSSSYAPYNTQHVPSLSYPNRSEDSFIPGVHVDDRRVAPKRRNPITHPVDGVSAGGYYPGSSSNNQFSGYVPLNPVPTRETCPPQISSNMGSSHWNDHQFLNHEGSQRNVRGRHDHSSIHSEYNSSTACPSSSVHVPPYHPNANAPFGSAPVQRERAPLSLPPRIVPPGTDGSTGIAFRERPFYPAPQSTNISAPVPTLPGSSDVAPFAHIGYTPRPVHHNAGHNYPPPAFTTSSNSGAVRCEPANPRYQPSMTSYPPATAAASSSVQPLHAEAAASFRQPRHVSVGHGGSTRSRRMRDSYHCFHPLMIEENNLGRSAAERFMMLDQLVIHESREALDPHWDMRLDIDDMSYEELLALEERIGNVNTGLADEKISGCVMELACRNSARTQNDQDKERCIICLEEYKHKDSLGKLKCGHDFHAGCIKKWLEVKNACPVCKADAANETT